MNSEPEDGGAGSMKLGAAGLSGTCWGFFKYFGNINENNAFSFSFFVCITKRILNSGGL